MVVNDKKDLVMASHADSDALQIRGQKTRLVTSHSQSDASMNALNIVSVVHWARLFKKYSNPCSIKVSTVISSI